MKILYAGKTITIKKEDSRGFKIIPKEDFDALLEKGLSRKKAREFNIGNSLWNNSYNYHYRPDEIEKHRIDKIKTTNAIKRYDSWNDNLKSLEIISPGITKLFKENLKNNPEILNSEIDRLNDLFHEMKIFIRLSKKYIRQACNRKGIKPIKLVANTAEYRLKKILKELKIEFEVQPYIDKHWFDFKVGKTIIELDGENFHEALKDGFKDNIAKKYGLEVIRIDTKELNNIETLKNKLKCLLALK